MSAIIGPLMFVVYAVTSVSGLLTIKHAFNNMSLDGTGWTFTVFFSPSLAIGIMLYGVSFLIWLRILSSYNLSVVFPIVIGLSIVGNAIGSVLFLGESLSPVQLAATAFVIVAIGLFAL